MDSLKMRDKRQQWETAIVQKIEIKWYFYF